jgi:uncharacterized membrane protein YhiD involved in acid resistance
MNEFWLGVCSAIIVIIIIVLVIVNITQWIKSKKQQKFIDSLYLESENIYKKMSDNYNELDRKITDNFCELERKIDSNYKHLDRLIADNSKIANDNLMSEKNELKAYTDATLSSRIDKCVASHKSQS